ncbi:hypothetical protein [Carboxylicivirga sp. RSCT41]|uniref:hypothetical protein n=1 Tax=Carboxylicivirga agarovorans TaxID=3417570 RepID=UPI003D34E864
MRRVSILLGITGLLLILSSNINGQSNRLIQIVDSITTSSLTYELDTNLTNVIKPQPLIMIDGHLTSKRVLKHIRIEDIVSIHSLSDSIAFQTLDPKAWGGIIIIQTNLKNRKLKKILRLNKHI